MKKTIYAILALTILAILITGCTETKEETTKEPIKVGFASSLSGDAAAWGVPVKDGFEFKINQINENGGINGRQIQVIYEDTTCDAVTGLNAFNKLIDVDKVKIITGSVCSTVGMAVADKTQSSGVLYVATGATNPALVEEGDLIFRMWVADDYEAETIAEYASKELGLKTFSIIGVNDNPTYTTGIAKFTEIIERNGATLLAKEDIKSDQTSFMTEITKAIQNNPEAIYVTTVPEKESLLINKIREQGYKGIILGYGPSMITEGEIDNIKDKSNIYYTSPVDVRETSFWTEYKEKTGKEPDVLVSAGYDSALMIENGLKKCGEDNECIKNYYLNTESFQISRGTMSYDEYGNVLGIGYEVLAVESKTEPKGKVKIGLLGPLTGDAALYGQNPQKGALLAIEEINSEGGIKGYELELVSEDSKCDAATGVSSVKKFIELDGVEYIVGGMCSSVTLAIAPTVEENQVLTVSPVSTNYKVSEAGDYIFRTVPSDALQGKKGAELAYNNGFKKAAVFYIGSNDYGAGLKQVFEERFTELGGEVVISETHLAGDNDFRTQLTKIKAANPDVIYLPTQTQEAGTIVKQAKELGMNIQFIGTETMQDEQFLDAAGASAEGVMFTSFAEYNGESSKEFAESYTAKFSEEKGIFSDYAYDAIYAIANAMESCKPINTECVKNKLYDVSFIGATGPVAFDENGDVKDKEFSVFMVEEGEFVNQ